jgi:hypothetical protein
MSGYLRLVFRLGRVLGRAAEILHESCAGGLAGTLLEKIGRSFYDANFFGDGDVALLIVSLWFTANSRFLHSAD